MARYPDRPGHRNTDTSREAAEALSPHLGRLQALSNAAICAAGPRGLTKYETSDTLGIDYTAIHPRISELRKKGLVVDSGRRRPNPSGKKAIVWIAAPVLRGGPAARHGKSNNDRKHDDPPAAP